MSICRLIYIGDTAITKKTSCEDLLASGLRESASYLGMRRLKSNPEHLEVIGGQFFVTVLFLAEKISTVTLYPYIEGLEVPKPLNGEYEAEKYMYCLDRLVEYFGVPNDISDKYCTYGFKWGRVTLSRITDGPDMYKGGYILINMYPSSNGGGQTEGGGEKRKAPVPAGS